MKSLSKRPLLLFLPFLILYLVIIVWQNNAPLLGDGRRYMQFAENLLQGFYSPTDRINLWNGPGYPIFLMPFAVLGLSPKFIVFSNAFLLYGSLIFFYKTCRALLPPAKAIAASLSLGVYFLIAYHEMSFIAYESLSIFLVCSFMYFTTQAYLNNNRLSLWSAGFFIGYLTLTKVIFGYVIFGALLLSILTFFWGKEKQAVKRAMAILGIGCIVILPYLIYTFQLTKKAFYLSNAGGLQLYWMSTTFEHEYGDFNRLTPSHKGKRSAKDIPELEVIRLQYLQRNHNLVFEQFQALDEVAKDAAFKKKAIKNIIAHPGKYLKNVFANAGRLFFGMPNSYVSQRVNVLFRIGLHGFLLVFMFISGIVSGLRWGRLPFSLRFILAIALIYTGGSLLVSSVPRFFYIIVPAFVLWIFYIFEHELTIKLK